MILKKAIVKFPQLFEKIGNFQLIIFTNEKPKKQTSKKPNPQTPVN